MAAPVLVQSASNTGAAGTSVTVTLSSPVTAHNCLVVCVGEIQGSTNPTVSGITIGGSADNFAAAVTAINNSFSNAETWVDLNCAGGSTSVVVNFNAGTGLGTSYEVFVMEWANVLTASAVDKTNGANSSGTSWSSGSTSTLTQANEVVIGFIKGEAGSTPTITGPSSPWTNLTAISSGTGNASVVGYQVVSSTTAQTYSGTFSANSFWASTIVSLKGTAAAPAVAGYLSPVQPGQTWKRRFRHRQFPVSNTVTQVNVAPSVPQPQNPILPGATWKRRFQRTQVTNWNTVTYVNQAPAVSLPQLQALPGSTWRRFYKNNFRLNPLQPAAGQVQPPVSPPAQPVNPGKAWSKRFRFPKPQQPFIFTSPSTKGLTAGVTVAAGSVSEQVNLTSRLFGSSVSVNAYSGTCVVSIHETGNYAVTPRLGTITADKHGNVSTDSISASFGSLSNKASAATAHVNVTAYFGATGTSHPLTGFTAAVAVNANYGHVTVSASFHDNISVSPFFGSLKTNVPVPAKNVPVSSSVSAKIVYSGAVSKELVFAEFGHVHAGNTQAGSVSAVSVAAHFGTTSVSIRKTAAVSVSSVISSRISVSESAAGVHTGAVFGGVFVSLKLPKNVSVSSGASTKITPKSITGKFTVKSKVSAAVSVQGTASAVTINAFVHGITTVPGRISAAQVNAVYGSVKVIVAGSRSGISAVAQRQGTRVAGLVSSVQVTAHMGMPGSAYSALVNISAVAHQGTAGTMIITGHLDDQQWMAHLFKVHGEFCR